MRAFFSTYYFKAPLSIQITMWHYILIMKNLGCDMWIFTFFTVYSLPFSLRTSGLLICAPLAQGSDQLSTWMAKNPFISIFPFTFLFYYGTVICLERKSAKIWHSCYGQVVGIRSNGSYLLWSWCLSFVFSTWFELEVSTSLFGPILKPIDITIIHNHVALCSDWWPLLLFWVSLALGHHQHYLSELHLCLSPGCHLPMKFCATFWRHHIQSHLQIPFYRLITNPKISKQNTLVYYALTWPSSPQKFLAPPSALSNDDLPCCFLH